jgi:hypothetical protein
VGLAHFEWQADDFGLSGGSLRIQFDSKATGPIRDHVRRQNLYDLAQ